MYRILHILLLVTLVFLSHPLSAGSGTNRKPADKPLYRDPVFDGAADPVVVWNEGRQCWFMYYTNRRANLEQVRGVDWVHGTPIGIACSSDGGASWEYLCDAEIPYGGENYTFWAPDVIEWQGTYHMYLTVVPGTFTDWSHPREIVHLTSTDGIGWHFESRLELASDKVIDAGVFRTPDGEWQMYYNNEKDRKSIYSARSADLYTWEDTGKVVGDKAGEGPKVFYWKRRWFMIVDHWNGLGVYTSKDLESWTRQPDNILQAPGTGPDDGVIGQHADVVVNRGRAYIFYFTHPGRTAGAGANDSYETRRSSIQVAELKFRNGVVSCNRDEQVYIDLKY